jgi:ribosomal-protein-alanine N-acetyltransferase
VIIGLSDRRLVGTCLAFDFDTHAREIEFGYVLSADHWGQGYMIEAMQAFTAALSGTLALNSLKVCVNKSNAASLSLLKKLGFEIDASKPLVKNAGLLALRKHGLAQNV